MPLPLILGIGAGIAGLTGIGAGVHAAKQTHDSKKIVEIANKRHEANIARLQYKNEIALRAMDNLGKLELIILDSFSRFSDMIEKLQNRPEFKTIKVNGTEIPVYSPDDLKEVSIGASTLLGGLLGAGLGTAGGLAAAGGTSAAVMAIGTASTGVAISSLSGAAATNATLAALGGGAIAAGGGGMALGTMILGGATLGVGLLVGGLIFSITGSKLSKKAAEVEEQMLKAEKDINRSVDYLESLERVAIKYSKIIKQVAQVYKRLLTRMEFIILDDKKTDWNTFSDSEKLTVENCSYLVGLLYEMCKVQIVLKAKDQNDLNIINLQAINDTSDKAKNIMSGLGYDIVDVEAKEYNINDIEIAETSDKTDTTYTYVNESDNSDFKL